MSMDGIRVNHGALETAAADLGTAVKGIDDRLNQLEQELAPLKSDWTGNAQNAYTTAKAKWDGAINQMKQTLSETSTTVSQSNSEYRDADKKGAAAFDI